MTIVDRSGPLFYVKISPRGRPGEGEERIDVSTKVTSFVYEDDEKAADKLMIEIDNFDQTEVDTGRWEEGQTLEVAWGYPDNFSQPRKCVIKKVSTNGRRIKVEAHGQAVLMDRELRSRTFFDLKRSEVVKTIAEENGYAADRQFIDDTEVVIDTITQGRMSDAQFLRHLANREGFEFFVDFDGLHWHERKLGQRPIRRFVYYNDQRGGDVIDWSVEGVLSQRASTVRTKGRDPLDKSDVEGEASNSTEAGRPTLGSTVITMDNRTGEGSINPAADQTRRDEVQPTSETSAEAAKREASGRFRRSAANSFRMKLTVVGDPGIVAKSTIEISGISEKLGGRYYVSKVKHDLGGGYKTTLECKRNASNASNGMGKSSGIISIEDGVSADGGDGSGALVGKLDRRTGAIAWSDSSGRTSD